MARSRAGMIVAKTEAPEPKVRALGRPRAADHDAKRQVILDKATMLFAENGYSRTAISEITAECGVSKALLYHYYANKEDLLFAILEAHFQRLAEAVNAVDRTTGNPRARLRALVGALLKAYEGQDATHKVQLHDLGMLPPARQKVLKDMERGVVALFTEALCELSPQLAGKSAHLLKPVTMSLFGMLNWQYLWFKPTGALTRSDFADLVTNIIVGGLKEAS